MRTQFIQCGALLGSITLCCGLAAAKSHQQVQIDIGELVGAGPTQPVELLSKALKQHRTASRFRVTWSDFGSMGSCKATILYDRSQHTLKKYSSGSRKVSEGPEEWIAEQQAAVYHSVNDRVIYSLANRVKGRSSYTPDDAYFSELTSLGCRKEGIVYKVRRYSP